MCDLEDTVKPPDYLHRCLELFGQTTLLRYGKRQCLGKVERRVADMLEQQCELWEIIHAIYNSCYFDASVFGFLPRQIEAELKQATWYKQWRTLSKTELVERLLSVFRQIEPVSVVMRFIHPQCCGIISSPVTAMLGLRPRRKPKATYEAYLKSLRKVRQERGFERVADVDMALWVLRVGVLDGLLPAEHRDALQASYRADIQLRQLATSNLTTQLFSENSKLDVAESLLRTNVELAGQIAGIEFEQLVGKRVRAAGYIRNDPTLQKLIDRIEPACLRPCLHRARKIRNNAIHTPNTVTKDNVEFLIAMARKIDNQLRHPQRGD